MKQLILLIILTLLLNAKETISSYSYELTGLGVKPFIWQDGNWHDSEKLWVSNGLDTSVLGSNNHRLTYYDYTRFNTLHSGNSSLENDTSGIISVLKNGNEIWLAGPNYYNVLLNDNVVHVVPYSGNTKAYVVMKGVDDLYWFNNFDGEIFKYNNSDQGWTVYDTSTSGLNSDFVDNVFADSHGNIWVNHILRYPVKKSSISRMDSSENWYVYDSSNDVFANTIIKTSSYNKGIHEDHNRNVWFTTWGSITRFDGENFYNYIFDSELTEGEQFHEYVFSPVSDSAWFSSENTLAIWDGENMSFSPRDSLFPSQKNLLKTDTYVDNNGHWWQSKYRKVDGVYYYSHAVYDGSEWLLFDTCSWWDSTLIRDGKTYKPNGDGFWSMKEQLYTIDSLEYNELIYVTRNGYERFNFFNTGPANDTTYAMASTNNYTYFATKFGLSYRSRTDSSWDCWRPVHFVDSTNFLIDSISTLTSANNRLWVGTNSDYSEYPLACLWDNRWEFYTKEQIGSSDITALTVADDNTLFIGTGSGIIQYSHGVFTPLDNSLSVTALTEKDGVLWAAAETGLFRFTGTVRDSLAPERFSSLCCDTSGVLWAGMESGGIVLFDGSGRATIGTSDGVPGNSVSAIECDSFGTLWVGTDKGVGKWNGVEWKLYNSSNSVLQSDNIGFISVSPDGSKWLGTRYKGVVHLEDEELIPVNSSVTPVADLRSGMKVLGDNLQLTLTGRSAAKLNIYDLRGRLLVHRNLGELDAGVHSVPLDQGLSRGCYIARITAGDLVQSVRVVR